MPEDVNQEAGWIYKFFDRPDLGMCFGLAIGKAVEKADTVDVDVAALEAYDTITTS